jgi:dihydrofolate reductase
MDYIWRGRQAHQEGTFHSGLIDEFHLFINPVAIGNGMYIFKDLNETQKFNLVKSLAFDCGIIVLHYEPKRV